MRPLYFLHTMLLHPCLVMVLTRGNHSTHGARLDASPTALHMQTCCLNQQRPPLWKCKSCNKLHVVQEDAALACLTAAATNRAVTYTLCIFKCPVCCTPVHHQTLLETLLCWALAIPRTDGVTQAEPAAYTGESLETPLKLHPTDQLQIRHSTAHHPTVAIHKWPCTIAMDPMQLHTAGSRSHRCSAESSVSNGCFNDVVYVVKVIQQPPCHRDDPAIVASIVTALEAVSNKPRDRAATNSQSSFHKQSTILPPLRFTGQHGVMITTGDQQQGTAPQTDQTAGWLQDQQAAACQLHLAQHLRRQHWRLSGPGVSLCSGCLPRCSWCQ